MNVKKSLIILSVTVLMGLGFYVGDTLYNLSKITSSQSYGLEDIYLDVESLYNQSDAIIMGTFIKKHEPVSWLVKEDSQKYVVTFYDFKVTKVYKGIVTEKVIQLPIQNYMIYSDGVKSREQTYEYPLNKKTILFTYFVQSEINNKDFYKPISLSQSVITLTPDGQNVIVDTDSKLIFRHVKKWLQLESKLKNLH